ncbi:MAG: DoxX family protein [Gammaproteobacteria bacterium]|nr:DoxX family protein [Gammaproteobacteria bacterium]
MIDSKTAPYAALVLRVSLGVMFIAHSVYLKAFVFSLPGTAQFFASIGLPAILAYLVFIAEAAGGVLLIAGLYARGVALALIPILIGAAWVHWPNGWLFSNPNGGWEYPVFLAAAALAQALLGAGAFAVSGKRGANRAPEFVTATEA